MKQFKKKLRSRVGASMLLALVFMLFASFVGSSVLASATANAQRVAQMAEQQDFLLERSAVLLASDMFQLEDSQHLRLVIQDSKQDIKEMKDAEGGRFDETGRVAHRRVITMQVVASATITKMQQLLLETTVYRYLVELSDDPVYQDVEIHFVGFPGDPMDFTGFLFQFDYASAKNNHGIIEGAMTISAAVSGSEDVTIPSYPVNFTSGRGTDLFDFFLYFGENSQVKMTLNAYHGIRDSIVITNPTEDDVDDLIPGDDPNGKDDYIQIVENITQHTISWEEPMIEKGGA